MTSIIRTLSLTKRAAINYFGKRPFCVSFEVTHSCNAKCKHCHLGGPFEENRASPETYGKICREIRPLLAQASGGEPLLRKDLEDIIKAFRIPNRAPYIAITTNGSLLTKKRYDSLMDAGVDEFSISLDYPDERHDQFRGIPGLFSKISDLAGQIRSSSNKHITLCCVIQADNFRLLLEMAELAKSWNVKINFSVYTYLRTQDHGYLIQENDLDEYSEIVSRLIDFKKQHGILYTSDYVLRKSVDFFRHGLIPDCRTGERFLNVNPDGTFSPCGLIITDYKSKKELYEKFSKTNTCVYCYTGIRSNSEKPTKYLLMDSLRAI